MTSFHIFGIFDRALVVTHSTYVCCILKYSARPLKMSDSLSDKSTRSKLKIPLSLVFLLLFLGIRMLFLSCSLSLLQSFFCSESSKLIALFFR
jgi:hypothetical protein